MLVFTEYVPRLSYGMLLFYIEHVPSVDCGVLLFVEHDLA